MHNIDSIIIGALTLIFLVMSAMLGTLVRVVAKWTRTEDKISNLAEDMQDLVKDKDRVHSEMLAQMREDRSATDRRLRWLEEHLWRGGSPK